MHLLIYQSVLPGEVPQRDTTIQRLLVYAFGKDIESENCLFIDDIFNSSFLATIWKREGKKNTVRVRLWLNDNDLVPEKWPNKFAAYRLTGREKIDESLL